MKMSGLLSVWLLASLTLADECNFQPADLLRADWYQRDQVTVNLKWAACALQNGDDEAAMSAYERVLMADPHQIGAAVALVRLYRTLGMARDAQLVLDRLDRSALSEEQRRRIAALETEEGAALDVRAKVTAGIGYDDNINFNIEEDRSRGSQAGERRDSLMHHLGVRAGIRHDPGEKGGTSLRAHIDVDWKSAYESHYYDVISGGIDAGVAYESTRLELYLPLVYSHMHYFGRDLYGRYGIEPVASFLLDDDLYLMAGAKVLWRDYFRRSDKSRSDLLAAGNAGISWYVEKNYLYLQGDYDHYSAQHTPSERFTDRQMLRVLAGFGYGIADLVMLEGAYQYAYVDYDDTIAAGVSEKRLDRFSQTTVTLSRALGKSLKALLQYGYSDNRSNFAIARYYKQMTMLSCELTF